MTLHTEPYADQVRRWPSEGRHILAHFDTESIIVYQAYRPAITRHAVQHRQLGGEGFSYARMSWIKPNFLWMMYRSGWGTKPDQQATLALRIGRPFFDDLLVKAVPSTFDPRRHNSREAWQAAVASSDVRLQWDPDHDPHGAPRSRRALQLGLRGATLERFGKRELIEVIDLSDFVAEQRPLLASRPCDLQTPAGHVYVPQLATAVANVGLST